jgi:hypothetical protein
MRALFASAVEIFRGATAEYRAGLIAHDIIPDARSKAMRN